jgi:tRNA threonylcarbamoyladenosine biosynthesis protein TsaE
VALYGELGSGKTVFAAGVIHGLGVEETVAVTSPTFIIVNEYKGRLPVHHVDAYRLRGAKDIVSLGSRELFFDRAASVVEWADRVEDALPDGRVNVSLEITGPTARRISISASGPFREVLSGLAEDLALEEAPKGPRQP